MNLEDKNDAEDVKITPDKDRFPRIVIIIVIAEFCERFSYSGMRAFLTIYLRSKLGYSDDGATEIYHLFSTLVYMFPIFGGIVADNYLGKFRTILYMLFVYAAGNILVAVTAIPHLALPARLCTLIGLFMITVGTGGIKPCVTAFGGDQFKLPAQERHLAVYFSVLYFALCTASLVSKTISPILRAEVSCFGDMDCYSLAFGAPGLVIIISIIIFASAKSRYHIKSPEGNVVFDFIKCIAAGLKDLVTRPNSQVKPAHWLDTTEPRFGKAFVRDVKKSLSILMLFTVLPVFWALLDQLVMGSRWTLQATKMDGDLGFLTIKPDQMQVLVPTFVLVYLPLTQKYIYPFLERRGVLLNPLHKLTLGGVLAGIAFISSGLVEIYLKTTYPVLPSPGLAQLRIFNGNPCSISIENRDLNTTYTIPPLAHYSRKDFKVLVDYNKKRPGQMTVMYDLRGECIEPRLEAFNLEDNAAMSFYLTGNDVVRYVDHVAKSKAGFPVVSFLVPPTLTAANLTFRNDKRHEVEAYIHPGLSHRMEMFASTYSVWAGDTLVENGIVLKSGGVYVVMVDRTSEGYVSRAIVVTEPNSITMAWLLPQFLIMSAAEVLFAVTGYEFAFRESPESMKAVMSAMFLFTEAMGNILIIVVTRVFANYSQETQSFIYTGLMFVSISMFHCMARGYRFKRSTEDIALKCDSDGTEDVVGDRTVEEDVGRKYRSSSLGYQPVWQFED